MSFMCTAFPVSCHSIIRVLWAAAILCISSCTAAERCLSTPSAFSRSRTSAGTVRPALDRLLSPGEIRVAEEHLRDFGFDPGPVEGLFTAETQAAVRAFQARYGLAVSGLLDHETRQELLPGLDQWQFDP
jgi:hypothetical protein